MASAGPGSAAAAAMMLHAAFILLSGAAAEPRRCYWCGPLAEQVHRSRRSAPCGASTHETDCEPGYNYCAVVATSPPLVESRYCVKMYQDECYPLYCNSTKTWKMTCPCRGDLCNGPNTEREHEAFALLPKLVAKTHNARIKKRTAKAAPHFIKHDAKNRIISNGDAEIHNISNPSSIMSSTNDNKLIVTENDVTMSNFDNNPNQRSGNMQSHEPTNQPIVVENHDDETDAHSTVANPHNVQTSTINNQLIEIVIHVSDPTEKPDTKEHPCIPCTDSTTESNDINKNTESVKGGELLATTVQSVSNTETPMKSTEILNSVESETMKTTENVHQSTVEIKPTDKPLAESPTTTSEIMPNEPMNPMDQMQNDAPLVVPTDAAQSLKTTEVTKLNEASTRDTSKANDGIPTAEALQQNGNSPVSAGPVPIEKSTEAATTESTTITTILTTQEQTAKITTLAPRRKNNAARITFSYTLLLSCVVFL